jgi:hypothetical protein
MADKLVRRDRQSPIRDAMPQIMPSEKGSSASDGRRQPDERRPHRPLPRRIHPPRVAGLTAVATIRPPCSITGLSDALRSGRRPWALTALTVLVLSAALSPR